MNIRGRLSTLIAMACAIALVVLAQSLHGVPRLQAQQSTPPVPPTFIPTPVGGPPAPPTPTAAATSTSTATPEPTATVNRDAVFSLDAARVSKLNNPGNLNGLSAVRPGSHVWLMMYYTVRSMTKPLRRVTSYAIKSGDRFVFKVAYTATAKPSQIGRFSRFTVYTIPRSLPFGRYEFRAVLALGPRHETKIWHFSVAKHDHVVSSTSSS